MENNSEPQSEPPGDLPAEIPPKEIPFADTDVSFRYEDVYEDFVPDEIQSVNRDEGVCVITSRNGVVLRIGVCSNHILRIRYSPDGHWKRDFSYAIAPTFVPEPEPLHIQENKSEFVLSSESWQIVVNKANMRLRIFDNNDYLVHEDALGFSAQRSIMQGWRKQAISKACHRKALFYGLGDKTSEGANLHGKTFENWCSDSYGFGPETDPLYRAIPFFYVIQNGKAHGIFLDNTFKSHFSFNPDDDGTVDFWADGGELNYYLINGPSPDEVARQYHLLTGTHSMPPMWALGYHQSRWSYIPESKVLEVSNRFRKLKIPCDAIYLDIDYMQGFRCFTWNPKLFPDPKLLIAKLKEIDFRTVVMVDPGIKEDPEYSVYQDGLDSDHFVTTSEGDVAKAPVWPGFCAFPDFTRPTTRKWWGSLFRKPYLDQGVDGFWLDMNEPAVFFVNHKTLPDHVMHHFDGDPGSHRKAHNIYGMQMARATREGLAEEQPDKRPFLLTRASFSGGQRYAAIWTGDNFSSWEHLQIANIQCQRLSISGFSFCGTDIGGFAGEPDGELYTRWLQLAVFHPVMRTHTKGAHETGDAIDTHSAEEQIAEMSIHPSDREPWSFGERWTEIARKAIELRYCLLPVIYTAFYRLNAHGIPIIRHAVFAEPDNPKLWNEGRDFLFGEHLFVSPVVNSKVQRQMVNLPEGDWYYFWTGQLCQGELFINLQQDQIPYFVRAGSVLVTYPARQHTAEPIEEITLYCYYKNGHTTTEWYEDEGDGLGYQDEQYCLSEFITEGGLSKYTLNWVKSGVWSPVSRKTKLYLIGFPTFAHRCIADGKEHPIKEIRLKDKSLYTVTLDGTFNSITWEE